MFQMTRRSLLAAGAGLAAAGALGRGASAQGAMTELKVSLNAPYDGSNAAFFLAEQRGYYSAAGLHCQFDTSGGAVESVGRIGTGVYDFAFTDLNVLIDFAAKNPDKAPRDVFMLYYRSPLSVITFAKYNITKASDLAGKTIGAAITDGAYRLFPAYCKATGLDPNSVKWKFVDLRLRETLLLRGEVEAILGFDSTSYFNLIKAGAKPGDVKFLYYADVGMPIYGNSLAASQEDARHQSGRGQALRRRLRPWLDGCHQGPGGGHCRPGEEGQPDRFQAGDGQAELGDQEPNLLTGIPRERAGARGGGAPRQLHRDREECVRTARGARARGGLRRELHAAGRPAQAACLTAWI